MTPRSSGERHVRDARVGDRRSATSPSCAEHQCVNESANAIDDNAGAQLFFQGEAAMHPIGSWLVSWAIDEAPDLEFDFVNLPAMPEGSAGDQGSVIGVETGYMVNANSPNIDLADRVPGAAQQPGERPEVHARRRSSRSRRRPPDATWTARSRAPGRAARTPPRRSCCRRTPATTSRWRNELYARRGRGAGGQATPADALAALDERAGPLGRMGRARCGVDPHAQATGRRARTLALIADVKPDPPPHALAVPRARASPCSAPRCCCRWCSRSGYSFTEWNGFGPMTFVGLDNYARAARRQPLPSARSCTCSSTSRRRSSWRWRSASASPGSSSARAGRTLVPGRDLHPGHAADGRRRGPLGVHLQPGLRAHQRRPRGGRARGAPAHLAGRPRDRAARDQRRVGLGVRGLLHDDLLRRVPAGAVRGPRGGAPRRRRRVGALPARQGADDPRRDRRSRSCCA